MKCPICGTIDTIGSADSGSPIQQYCCINGHRFKIATCYKMDPPYDFDIDHYDWTAKWEPVND